MKTPKDEDGLRNVQITPNKVFGIALIGFANLILILWDWRIFPLNMFYYSLAICEHLLLESGSLTVSNSAVHQQILKVLVQNPVKDSFDFRSDATKITYASTKLVYSTALLTVYGLFKLTFSV